MSEMQDTVQIIAITAQAGAKILGFGFRLAKATGITVAKLLNTLYLAKWKGKTSFNRFRAIKGEEMQFMCIHTEDKAKIRQIFNEMKKHGILTGRLPDLCKNDGMVQFIISPSDMRKMEAFLINHSRGKNKDIKVEPISATTYQKTGFDKDGKPTQEMQDLEKSAKEQMEKGMGGNVPTQTEDKLRSFHQLATVNEMQTPEFAQISASQDAQLFRHSRVTAIALPGSPNAVLVPNSCIKVKKDGSIDIYLDVKKNYTLINKKKQELSVGSGRQLAKDFEARPYKEQKAALLAEKREQMPEIAKITVSQENKLFQHSRVTAFALPASPYAVVVPNSSISKGKDGGANIYLNMKENYVLINKRTHEVTTGNGAQLAKDFEKPSYKKVNSDLLSILGQFIKKAEKQIPSIKPIKQGR